MPITPPPQMPDFDTAVGAKYWDVHVSGDHQNIPGNMMAVAPRRCDNPNCSTGCPGVAVIVRVGQQTVEVQFDAEAALHLSTMIAHSAFMANPKLKEGSN